MNKSPTPNFEKRNFRINEFTQIYGISRSKAYLEIGAGRLRSFKVGKITLISKEAAEAWQTLQEGEPKC